jgi:hypothetical protein
MYDTKGSALARCNDSVGWTWLNRLQEFQQANQMAGSEEAIQFSGLSKEMRDSLVDSFTNPPQPSEPRYKFTPAMKEFFLNIDQNEPLSLVATESLFEVARLRKLNLVACLPDRMFLDVSVVRTKEVKPATVLANAPRHGCEVKIADGWMVWKPRESSWVRSIRSDRALVANYVRSIQKSGLESLEGKARFAFRSGKEGEESLPSTLMSFLNLLRPGLNFWDWDTLRLYGSLTPTQLRMLRSDQDQPFRSLQPAQREIIRHLIFDVDNLQLEFAIDAEGPYRQEEEGGEVTVENELQYEATELLPNGFTGNETLALKEILSNIAFGRPSPNDPAAARWVPEPVTAEDLAMEIFAKERPEFASYIGMQEFQAKMTEFCSVNSREVRFLAQLKPQATFFTELTEHGAPAGPWVPVEKLSGTFKKQIDDFLAELRESYKNVKPPANPPAQRIPPPSSSSRR